MDLSKVRKMAETRNWEHANKFIESGWVLINIYNTAHPTSDPKIAGQEEHFTLGWTEGEPQYPDLSVHYESSGDFLNPD